MTGWLGTKGSGPGHVCSRQHAPAGLRHERTHEGKSDKTLLSVIYIIQEAKGGKGINTGQNRTKPYVYMTMIKNQGGNYCETTLSGKSLQGQSFRRPHGPEMIADLFSRSQLSPLCMNTGSLRHDIGPNTTTTPKAICGPSTSPEASSQDPGETRVSR